jgi:hypothetical protein
MAGAEPYSRKNILGSVGKGLAIGALFGGGGAGGGRGGVVAGDPAAEYYNRDLFEGRQSDRRKGELEHAHGLLKDNAPEGTQIGSFKHGTTAVTYRNSPKSAAPASETKEPTRQFNKPMPAFSVAGPNGKRQKNPDYVAWNQERSTFNADATAGNAQPVGLAPKPGKAPVAPKPPKA